MLNTQKITVVVCICGLCYFLGDTIPQAVELMDVLVQTITKATSQPNQSNLVSEAVTASCLLVKLSLVDIQAGKTLCYVGLLLYLHNLF